MARKTVADCQQEWMALRYTVDMMDVAWASDPDNLHPDLYDSRRKEFNQHRVTLLRMQDAVLERKYALEALGPEVEA